MMLAKHTTTVDVSASLERLLEAIRSDHSDLPYTLLSLGSGVSGRSSSLAKLDRGAWRDQPTLWPELFVSWEALTLGAEAVLALILHELTHALADVRGVCDTSKEGLYHSRKFRDLGVELGLEWPSQDAPDPSSGYASMAVSADTVKRYESHLDDLRKVSSGLSVAMRSAPSPSGRNNLRMECQCNPTRLIRASRRVADGPPIMCGACGGCFELPSSG